MTCEHWKSTLNAGCRTLYERMYYSFKTFKQEVPCGNADMKSITSTYEAVYNDHPELFYLSSAPRISQCIGLSGKSDKTICVDFIFTKSEIKAYQTELKALYSSLKSQMLNLSDKDREKVICDYIVENTTYEINNKYNQNAATVLFKNKGQCSGIAKATKLLLDLFNIESIVLTGEIVDHATNSIGSHAWNIVKIDNVYYHLDVTSIIGCNMSKDKPFTYLYYNYSDSQIENDHKWDRSSVPCCTSSNPDNDAVEICSLYELRKLLATTDFSKTSSLEFYSKIPCSSTDVLLNHILSTVKSVLGQMSQKKRVQIKATGQSISITFENV